MEDDKLDFGDLDDFDTQDGLLDQTEGFANNIEDLAAIEKELGIDDFGDIDTQQPTSITESKTSPKNQDTSASSKTTTSRPLVENTSSNNRPFVARNRHQYQNNNSHRYNPYQQQHYPTMPYQGFFPMPGGMPYGQGFMNMPIQGRMNGGMMGLPMMGYNNMPNGPPQSRRIHVNPKFAGARPPLTQTQRESVDQDRQQQKSHVTNEHRAEHGRKREREDDGQPHRQTNSSSQHSDQPSQRRRLDITPSSSPITSRVLQSKGSYESQRSPSSRRDTEPSTLGRHTSGISIRGAALAAATSGSTNNTNSNYGHDRLSSSQRPLSPPLRQSSTRHTNTSITSRLNLNNNKNITNKQHVSANDKNGMKSSILQRLGKSNNSTNSNDDNQTGSDRGNMISNNSNQSLTPQFANGKSSKLIISNISSSVTESELKALEPKDVKEVSLDRQANKATLLFVTIEPAVNFRRKYNRTMVGGQHISVTFAKP